MRKRMQTIDEKQEAITCGDLTKDIFQVFLKAQPAFGPRRDHCQIQTNK